jgi:hypothetical protein
MLHISGFGIRLTGDSRREHTGLLLPASQATWFVLVAAVAFLVPFVFTSVFDLNHDVYYLVYFAIALTVLAAYVRSTSFDLRQFFTQNWKLSLAVGAASTMFVVWNVVARNDSTPHPGGAYFAFEIGWRGVLYGVVDALLLNAFPGMVGFAVRKGHLRGFTARVQFGLIAFALTLIITASYHVGYEQFRSADVLKPEIGNTAIELPVIIAANPLGSIVAHTSMHVASAVHAYETDTFLPPQTFVDED